MSRKTKGVEGGERLSQGVKGAEQLSQKGKRKGVSRKTKGDERLSRKEGSDHFQGPNSHPDSLASSSSLS